MDNKARRVDLGIGSQNMKSTIYTRLRKIKEIGSELFGLIWQSRKQLEKEINQNGFQTSMGCTLTFLGSSNSEMIKIYFEH